MADRGEFIAYKEGLVISDVDRILNKESGLLGISGLTGDMRDLDGVVPYGRGCQRLLRAP